MSAKEETLQELPNAVLAEKDVLSMLIHEQGLLDEGPALTAEHFYQPGHRRVFELLREEHQKGLKFELICFVQMLAERGELDAIGGPAVMTELYTYEPAGSLDKFRRMHATLRMHMARRMAFTIAEDIRQAALTEFEPGALLSTTSEPITRLHDLLTDSKPPLDTKALLADWVEHFRALCMGESQPMGVETSLEEINRRFLGLLPKRTIVISAFPGGGKSAMIGQLAMDAALAGHHTLVCSLEMPAKDMMTRNMAYVSRVPGKLLMDPRKYSLEHYGCESPPKHVLRAIREAHGKILASPYSIEDLTSANIHQVIACIRRKHRRKPLKVVGVDFIQRVQPLPEMRRESQEQQYAHASHLLADLCKELDITVLLGSQLNKEGAAKYAEAINEDADLHLQIVQDRRGNESTHKHLGIAVVKDRHHGNDGAFLPLVLDKELVCFKPDETKVSKVA